MRTREVTLALTELEYQANTQAKERLISKSECRKIIDRIREIERLICQEPKRSDIERLRAESRAKAEHADRLEAHGRERGVLPPKEKH